MTFFQFIARVVLSTLTSAAAQDLFTRVGKYAVRQATTAVVRAVRNRTNLRKSPQTIS